MLLPPARGAALVLSAWLAGASAGLGASRTEQARQQAEEAEAARAAALAAQKQAQARAVQARTMLEGLASERMQAVAKLQQAEQHTLQAAERMSELQEAERRAREALAARAKALAPLLPVIERLSLFPEETLLAMPASPEEAARGLIILHGVARRLEAEALALRNDEARLAKAKADLAAEAPVLADAKTAQEQAAEELDRRMAAAQLDQDAAEREAEAQAERAAELAAKSANLHVLLERLEAARKEQAARALAARKEAKKRKVLAEAFSQPEKGDAGRLLVPVAGSVARGWGAPTEAGPAMGISYRTAPNARVVAPCTGTVAFAAPFRSYGDLLIMSCDDGVNAILTGFAKLSVHPGRKLRQGDPVGSMPEWPPGTPGPHPTLYVELRRHGEPVDPGPLLKQSQAPRLRPSPIAAR